MQGETGRSRLPRLLAGLENGSERKKSPKGVPRQKCETGILRPFRIRKGGFSEGDDSVVKLLTYELGVISHALACEGPDKGAQVIF